MSVFCSILLDSWSVVLKICVSIDPVHLKFENKMKVSNLELTDTHLIEYSGQQILQKFRFEEIDSVEEYRGYPVGHPKISFILGALLMIPILFFPLLYTANYPESGSGGGYTPERLAIGIFYSIYGLPIIGAALLWPLRRKKMNIKIYHYSGWKLVTFKDGKMNEIEEFLLALKSRILDKTHDDISERSIAGNFSA